MRYHFEPGDHDEFRPLSRGQARHLSATDRLAIGSVRCDNGCLVWARSLGHRGYGYVQVSGKKHFIHRLAYELAFGPIPEGLVIDHLCRNTACIEPTHLEAVTQRENVLRGISLSAQRARQTHCKNGHEFTDANTWLSPRGQRACRRCHRETVARRRKVAA